MNYDNSIEGLFTGYLNELQFINDTTRNYLLSDFEKMAEYVIQNSLF